MDLSKCIHPWAYYTIIQIGGCEYIGFDKDKGNYLLVCSSSGRGIVDCAAAKVVSRERSEYKANQLMFVEGIGPLLNQWIKVESLIDVESGNFHYNTLRTSDGWSIIIDQRRSIFLNSPNNISLEGLICIWKDELTSLIACSLSSCERYIAVASASEIYIFAKSESFQGDLYQITTCKYSRIRFVNAP